RRYWGKLTHGVRGKGGKDSVLERQPLRARVHVPSAPARARWSDLGSGGTGGRRGHDGDAAVGMGAGHVLRSNLSLSLGRPALERTRRAGTGAGRAVAARERGA